MIRVATPKDPEDIDDFTVDWANLLAASETISTFTATVDSGNITAGATAISGTATTVRVSGGTNLTSSLLRFRIVTNLGRQLDQSLVVAVEAQ